MKTLLVGAAALLVALVVLAVVTVRVATARWKAATAEAVQTLEAGARPPMLAGGPETLPEVVARYLDRSVPASAQPIRMARIHQRGSFQMGVGEAGWRPFVATQHVRAAPPGFLWDATIRMAPLVPVRVRDGYLEGAGMMKGALWALVVMVEGEPTRDLAEGSLYRYLAEAPWIPTRLIPGEGLSWAPVDDGTAVATLVDGDLSVAVEFHFDETGDVTRIVVPRRARVVDEEIRTMPWVGRFWGHREVEGGFRIPAEGEVAWVVDGVEVPYWRGTLDTVHYRF